jgi:hypothetical protein
LLHLRQNGWHGRDGSFPPLAHHGAVTGVRER